MVTIGTVQIGLEHTHLIMYLKSIFEVHFYLYFSWKTFDFFSYNTIIKYSHMVNSPNIYLSIFLVDPIRKYSCYEDKNVLH